MDSSILLDDFKALCGKTSNSICLLKLPLVLIRIAEQHLGSAFPKDMTNAWTTALASQVVELGGVPITKEEINDDEEEEEAGPSNKKLKKGGQQKINFPKVAAAHPASTGFVRLLLGMLIMGIKSVGGKRM